MNIMGYSLYHCRLYTLSDFSEEHLLSAIGHVKVYSYHDIKQFIYISSIFLLFIIEASKNQPVSGPHRLYLSMCSFGPIRFVERQDHPRHGFNYKPNLRKGNI